MCFLFQRLFCDKPLNSESPEIDRAHHCEADGSSGGAAAELAEAAEGHLQKAHGIDTEEGKGRCLHFEPSTAPPRSDLARRPSASEAECSLMQLAASIRVSSQRVS